MKGISTLMLIIACILSSSIYAMETVPAEEMQLCRAEIVSLSLECKSQVATLVESASYYAGLNTADEDQTEAVYQSLADKIDAVKYLQQREEEEGIINDTSSSVLLDNTAIKAALKANALAKETEQQRKTAIQKLEKAIGHNEEARGDFVTSLGSIEMNCNDAHRTLMQHIENLAGQITHNANLDEVTFPVTAALISWGSILQERAKTLENIRIKEAKVVELRKQLAQFQPVVMPTEETNVASTDTQETSVPTTIEAFIATEQVTEKANPAVGTSGWFSWLWSNKHAQSQQGEQAQEEAKSGDNPSES